MSILKNVMVKYLISGIVFSVTAILIIGKGTEGGDAVAKDVLSFLVSEISSSTISVKDYKEVPYSEVPLAFTQEIKYIAKQLLINSGIAIDRKIYAMQFDINSPYSQDRLLCLFRAHGDSVVRIIIKTDNKDDPYVIKLQKLLEKRFPDYEIAIIT